MRAAGVNDAAGFRESYRQRGILSHSLSSLKENPQLIRHHIPVSTNNRPVVNDILTTFYAYPAEVRKIIYTTNIIEGLNRQFRKITKNKPSFTNDDSLRKMLYLASQNIVNHWTVVCRNWDTHR